MSRSEAVEIESIEVREHLRFLFYLDILNKVSQYTCEACGLELQKKRTFPDPQGN